MDNNRPQVAGSNNTDILKKKTADSFGFEWTKFHQLKSEKGFLEFISPVNKGFFAGKFVLDAGCGNGSYSYYSSSYGADVIAVDFSNAVYVAKENTRDRNVQVVRADITRLPFREGSFDYIFSIGVLHHLPDPEKGFQHLVPLLKPGALISIWVYGRAKQWAAVYFYEPVIKITHRIPHRFLYYLCFLPAVIMQISNWAYRFFQWIRLPGIASLFPFRFYAEYPFSVKLNDAFDTFATPSAQYYSEEEILTWFSKVNLQDITITTEGVAKGIKGFGIRK